MPVFLGITELFASQGNLLVKINQQGLLVLEVDIDSVLIKADGSIGILPVLESKTVGGYPIIPEISEILVGIPADAGIEIYPGEQVRIIDYVPHRSPFEKAKGMDYEFQGNEWDGSSYPASIANLKPIGPIRGNDAVLLTINPVEVTGNHLAWYKSISIRISWNSPQPRKAEFLSRLSFSDLPVQNRQSEMARLGTIPSYQYSTRLARFPVSEDGWYVIEYQTLADSFDVTGIDPRSFRLWNKADEILIFVEGENDGIFNIGDRIIFSGNKNTAPAGSPYRNNFYTDDNL